MQPLVEAGIISGAYQGLLVWQPCIKCKAACIRSMTICSHVFRSVAQCTLQKPCCKLSIKSLLCASRQRRK